MPLSISSVVGRHDVIYLRVACVTHTYHRSQFVRSFVYAQLHDCVNDVHPSSSPSFASPATAASAANVGLRGSRRQPAAALDVVRVQRVRSAALRELRRPGCQLAQLIRHGGQRTGRLRLRHTLHPRHRSVLLSAQSIVSPVSNKLQKNCSVVTHY